MNDYPIRYGNDGAPDVTYERFKAVLTAAGSPAAPEAHGMYSHLAAHRVHPSVFLGFFHHESGYGLLGICKEYDTRNPGNVRTPEVPAPGITLVQTPRGQFAKFPNWRTGTGDWAARLAGPKYAGAGLTTVRQVLPKYAPASDNNTPENYIRAVLADIAVFTRSDAPGTQKGSNVTLAMREAIIPATNANRPKLPMTPKFITVHETANTTAGANAEMHRKFLMNGGGPEGVSFHWCVDDKEAVHLVPDNENAWHAGDGTNGPGNRTSIAIETCVNSDGDWAATIRNLAALVAILMQRHKIPLANVVQHNHWSGKDCPHKLRAAGWAGLLAAIKVATTAPSPPPFQHAPGFIGPPLVDTFNWGKDTAGIVVKRITEVYNDESKTFYRLTWTPDEGVKVEAI